MDAHHFQAQIGKEVVNVAWQNILFARLVENFLELGTSSTRYVVPLQHLDVRRIWEQFQMLAPSSAFAKGAYLRVPYYRQAISAYERLLADPHVSFRAGYSRSTQIIRSLWALTIILPGAFLVFYTNNSLFFAICLAPIGLLAVALALRSTQTLEVTSQKVIVGYGWRKNELHWQEIEKVRADPDYERFIFYGGHKRLVAPGLKWAANGEKMSKLLQAQIWKRQIEIEDRNRRRPAFLLNMVPLP